MYSSEYTSGFSGPAASHLAAPPSPRHEGNVEQAPSNMLKKSLFSPARPRRTETRFFPCGMLETREAYLVKRRSFPDSYVSRFTPHVSRC
jgi:hypothetical protein